MMKRILRKAMVFAGLALLWPAAAERAHAVITFSPSNQNIFSTMTVQSVVEIAGGYRMFLTTNNYTVMSATSISQQGWTLDAGVRLSTGPSVAAVDAGSITAVSVYLATTAGQAHRMYYAAISTAGTYAVLSATSTDLLTWSKSSSGPVLINGGGFIDTPRPIQISATSVRLFYVADNAGGNALANRRIFSAISTDGGLTFSPEGAVLAAQIAYEVSITTLSDGRTRLYYTAPLAAETTGSTVLSAISSNGTLFTAESGVRLSTASSASSISYPVVVRSTDAFRWRMFTAYRPVSTQAFATDAVTYSPIITAMTPTAILNSGSAVSFTLTGEIFGPATPAVTFNVGGTSITATAESLTNDRTLTGTLNPIGQTTGNWNAVLTNPDGNAATLVNAFLMEIPPGEVTIVDNLFRPLRGQNALITVKTRGAGRIRLKLFTLNGGLVATLADQDMPAGDHIFTWNGRTSGGAVVASGVYLLHVVAPRANSTHKIVVIK